MELTQKAGLPYSKIKQQRADSTFPKADVLLALGRALNVTVESLITGEVSYRISKEALAVENDIILKHLVRKCIDDRTLLLAIEKLMAPIDKPRQAVTVCS